MIRNYYSLLFLGLIFIFACSEEEPTPQGDLRVTAFESTIDENPQEGQSIGIIEVTGAEGTVNFTLSNESEAGALDINSATGEITVNDPSLFNFEANNVVTAVANVTADNGSATGAVTVNIRNVDESDLFTVWTGPELTFVKNDGGDPTQEANQDKITENVWITRGNDGGQIYNAKTEISATSATSPAGTQWALGQVEEIEALIFTDFRSAVGKPRDVVGKDLVMYLETEDVYVAVKFNSWSTGRAGGFSYTRSTQN